MAAAPPTAGRTLRARRVGVVPLALVVAMICASASAAQGRHTSAVRAMPADTLALDLAGRVRQASNIVLSPTGAHVAYILGDSLLVAGTRAAAAGPRVVATGVADEASAPVPFVVWDPAGERLLFRQGGTDDGVPVIVHRDGGAVRPLLADSVARTLKTFQNLFAGGPAWSPDGRRIAFLAHRRGDTTSSLQVHVADVATGALARVTGDGARRFAVAWSPDGRWLAWSTGDFTASPDRPATVELVDARLSPGATPVVAMREATAFLHGLRWSPDGTLLLAQDRARRTVVVRVGRGDDARVPRVEAVAHTLPARAWRGWLPDADGLGLLATVPAGMSARLARVAFPSGRVTYLTGPDTLARAVGSAGRAGRSGAGDATVAFTLESGALPSDVWVAAWSRARRADAGALGRRRNVTRAGAAFADAVRPHASVVRWRSGDAARGDTLEAQLLAPRGARPRDGWPVVVIPYGGYGNEFPRGEYFLDRGIVPLVAAGYAVLRPNTRGLNSDDRDTDAYGRPQLEDTERLLDTLAAQGVVDARRVAVVGHSHGGAMAYYYLTHATPRRDGGARFCAVVAVNGRADWVLQGSRGDGVLPDALGGTPAELPERYRAFSPVANAAAARAPLLAVAGAQDTQILPANVPAMAEAMRAAGRPVETLVFADEGHLLLQAANVRTFWRRAFGTIRDACGIRP